MRINIDVSYNRISMRFISLYKHVVLLSVLYTILYCIIVLTGIRCGFVCFPL